MSELSRRLDSAYSSRHAAIVDRLEQTIRTAWLALPNYRDADISRFKSFAIPVVESAHMQIAGLAAGFYAQYGISDGVATPRVLLPRDRIMEPRGVSNSDLVDRWAVTIYTSLSQGQPMTSAVAQSTNRLSTMVKVDAQLVRTTQANHSLSRSGYTYYKRVLQGERNCALCTIASTQRYKVADLMPIHGNCDCKPLPVKAWRDPGQVIDRDLLESTHARVKEFTGIEDRGGRNPDYRELITTRENSETGPTLVWRDQNFETPPF